MAYVTETMGQRQPWSDSLCNARLWGRHSCLSQHSTSCTSRLSSCWMVFAVRCIFKNTHPSQQRLNARWHSRSDCKLNGRQHQQHLICAPLSSHPTRLDSLNLEGSAPTCRWVGGGGAFWACPLGVKTIVNAARSYAHLSPGPHNQQVSA